MFLPFRKTPAFAARELHACAAAGPRGLSLEILDAFEVKQRGSSCPSRKPKSFVKPQHFDVVFANKAPTSIDTLWSTGSVFQTPGSGKRTLRKQARQHLSILICSLELQRSHKSQGLKYSP